MAHLLEVNLDHFHFRCNFLNRIHKDRKEPFKNIKNNTAGKFRLNLLMLSLTN